MRREGLLTGRVWNKSSREFVQVKARPTNASNFSGRCGLVKCPICHDLPVSKASSKTKGRKKWRSIHRQLSLEDDSVDDDQRSTSACPPRSKVAVSSDLYECDSNIYSNLDTFWDPVLPPSGNQMVVVCEAVTSPSLLKDGCELHARIDTVVDDGAHQFNNDVDDTTNDIDYQHEDVGDTDCDHHSKAVLKSLETLQDKSAGDRVPCDNDDEIILLERLLSVPEDQLKHASDEDCHRSIKAVLKSSENLQDESVVDIVHCYKDGLFLERLRTVLDNQRQDVSDYFFCVHNTKAVPQASTNLQDGSGGSDPCYSEKLILARLHSPLEDQQKNVSDNDCDYHTKAVANLQDKSAGDRVSSDRDIELLMERCHSVPDSQWQLCGSSSDGDYEADDVETMTVVSKSECSSSDWCHIAFDNTDCVSILDTDEWCFC